MNSQRNKPGFQDIGESCGRGRKQTKTNQSVVCSRMDFSLSLAAGITDNPMFSNPRVMTHLGLTRPGPAPA